MQAEQAAQGSAKSDNQVYTSIPLIGQLVTLPATHIKPNQPLINNETGELETVDKGKYFSSEDYSRYYVITDEQATSSNLVFALNQNTMQGKIVMYGDYKQEENETFYVCYPAANSIVKRLHDMYYETVKDGGIEYLRFTKIHNNKYAGFPSGNRQRIPANEAKERWEYIFQHVLITNPTNLRKKRIGVLFGTIAGADLRDKSTVDLIRKYRNWIIS